LAISTPTDTEPAVEVTTFHVAPVTFPTFNRARFFSRKRIEQSNVTEEVTKTTKVKSADVEDNNVVPGIKNSVERVEVSVSSKSRPLLRRVLPKGSRARVVENNDNSTKSTETENVPRRRKIKFRKRKPLLRADGTPDTRVFRPAGPTIKEFNETDELFVRVGSQVITESSAVDKNSTGIMT
jgi:hypothetical protein